MRRRYFRFGLATSGVLALQAVAQAQANLSFTTEQAVQGAASFAVNCAICHGDTLHGGPGGPALMDAAFAGHWRSQTAGALFGFIQAQMPPASPGSLSPQEYADILAYILQVNGLQPGESPLPADASLPAELSVALPPTPAKQTVADETSSGAEHSAGAEIAQAAFLARNDLLRKLRPVTDSMLQQPDAADWLTWRATYDAHGFSGLSQVNRRNVTALVPAWSWQLAPGGNEITPLVHDGVLFTVSSGHLQALDAATGDLLWQYNRPGHNGVVRNLAIYGEQIYLAAEQNVIALEMRTGTVVWDHAVAKPEDHIRFSGGPIAAKGKIFQGMGSCYTPYPGGCFIVALDAQTGTEIWRFNSIARPGQPGGDSWNDTPPQQRYGSSIWLPGSYDPKLDLLFFGTGQTYKTASLLQGGSGKPGSGDGLFTDTTLALRPDTGELVWYYQHLPRDVWDLDWAFERTVATLNVNGVSRRTVSTAGKLGIFDTLDAATGQYLFSYDVGLQTLIESIDSRTGVKRIGAQFAPQPGIEKLICTSALGGRDWPATAFNPHTGILYVPLNEACMHSKWTPGSDVDIVDRRVLPSNSDGLVGRVQAVDLANHRTVWIQRRRAPHSSAILATAGGLIFEGSHDGWFRASDDRTGKVLWQIRLDAPPSSFPVTYSVAGVQYIAVTTGGNNPLDSLMGMLTPEINAPAGGTTLWVFRLQQPRR